MRHSVATIFAFILLTGILPAISGQDCGSYFEEGDCRMDLQRGYEIYSQSKGIPVSTRDTVEMNVVFYGQKDYIFTFCADKDLYPIHFTINDPETGAVIYDNKEDRYIESLGIGFDVTRNLTFRITVLAETKDAPADDLNMSGCLGVLFQYRNYEKTR